MRVADRPEAVLPSRNHRADKVKPDHGETFDELVGGADTVRVMDFEDAGREAYEAANEVLVGTCHHPPRDMGLATQRRGRHRHGRRAGR